MKLNTKHKRSIAYNVGYMSRTQHETIKRFIMDKKIIQTEEKKFWDKVLSHSVMKVGKL